MRFKVLHSCNFYRAEKRERITNPITKLHYYAFFVFFTFLSFSCSSCQPSKSYRSAKLSQWVRDHVVEVNMLSSSVQWNPGFFISNFKWWWPFQEKIFFLQHKNPRTIPEYFPGIFFFFFLLKTQDQQKYKIIEQINRKTWFYRFGILPFLALWVFKTNRTVPPRSAVRAWCARKIYNVRQMTPCHHHKPLWTNRMLHSGWATGVVRP